jgi:putative redox protein
LLASLATCQEITYRLYADALNIPLTGVAVRIEGDLDLRGFFAVEDGVRPGYRSIRATVRLDSPAPEADLTRLQETVNRHCPVLDIVQCATPVEISYERVLPLQSVVA